MLDKDSGPPQDPSVTESSARRIHRRQRFLVGAVTVLLFSPFVFIGHGITDTHQLHEVSRQIHGAVTAEDGSAFELLFRNPYDQGSGRRIPLMRPYFYVLYLVFQENYLALHLYNVLLYVLLTQMVYTLTARLSISIRAPLVAGILPLLFWPGGAIFFVVYLLEPVISIFIIGAALLLIPRVDVNGVGRRRRVSPWIYGICSVILVAAAFGLKETTTAFFPSLVLVSLFQLRSKDAGIRLQFLIVLGGILILTALFYSSTTVRTINQGWYTRNWGFHGIHDIILKVFWWRDYMVAVYGPLLVLVPIVVLLRTVAGFRSKNLTPVLVWRPALLLFVFAALCVSMPWRFPVGRYFVPGACAMAVLIGCETAEAWDLFARRKGSLPPLEIRPSQFVLGLFVLLSVAAWAAPVVVPPHDWAVIALKIFLLFGVAGSGILLFRLNRAQFLRYGVVDRLPSTVGRGVLLVCALHMALYAAPMVWTSYTTGLMFKAHANMLEYLAESVPPDGRVAADLGRHSCKEIELHLKNCLDRPDISVVEAGADLESILPSDVVVTCSFFHYSIAGPEEVAQALKDQRRTAVKQNHRVLKFNAVWAQPGRVTLWALGKSLDTSLPPYYYWQRPYRFFEDHWTIYVPDSLALQNSS